MCNNLAVAIEYDDIIIQEQIEIALSAYKKEHILLKNLIEHSFFNYKEVELVFSNYPFTVDRMPYASINLINLGVEQAMIAHVDCDISNEKITGFWNNINDYRRLVNNGHWLVPRLITNIFTKIPLDICINVKTEIIKTRSGPNRYLLWFSVSNEKYFRSEGMAFLVKSL